MFWYWGADSWVKFCKTSADSDKSIWELVPLISSCKFKCCPGSSLFYRNSSTVKVDYSRIEFKNITIFWILVGICIEFIDLIILIRVIISIIFLYGMVFTGVLENHGFSEEAYNQKWFLKQLHILFIILSAFLNEIVSLEICLFHHTYERIVREYQSVTVRFCVIQCKKFLLCFFVYWKL